MIAFLPLAQDRLGTIPDWIGALGTVFAFFVALELLAKELAARREAEEDRRRAQARLVAQWIGGPEPEREGASNFVFDVVVRNGSDEPVYSVRLTMSPPGSSYAADPEAGPTELGTLKYELGNLPPGEAFSNRIRMVPTLPGSLGLSFTDAAGRRWKRFPDGRLVEPARQRRSRKDYMNAWIAEELDRLDY